MRRNLMKVKLVLLLTAVLLALLFIMGGYKNGAGDEYEDRGEGGFTDRDGHGNEGQDKEETRETPLDIPEQATRQEAPICLEDPLARNITGFRQLPPHIQEFLKYKHCRNFPQILDEPLKCGGRAKSKEVFLLLAIKSSPQNYERRAVLRQTWGQESSYQGARVKRIFLSGISANQQEDRHLRQLLKTESKKYKDILQWDFHDTFYNLTLKQFLFHRWLTDSCPGAHFIMNGDDDIFVNTVNMVRYLREKHAGDHLFVGQLIANVGPIRDPQSKYYIPVQVVSQESYPAYCGGGGILMSRYTAHTIYQKSLEIPLIPIDDVYLGMCLEKAGLAPASHMAMSTVGVHTPSEKIDSFDPCFYRQLLMVHRFVPFQMVIMWNAVQDPHLYCGKKLSVYRGAPNNLPIKLLA